LLWERHSDGDGELSLSGPDEAQLYEQLLEAAGNLKCMMNRDALNFTSVRKEKRCEKAKRLWILGLRMPALASEIEYSAPSDAWQRKFAARHELKICRLQQLEQAKSLACDTTTFDNWLTKVSYLIEGRDPRLIFNMDEIQLAARP
jgi:hypothetical protein